MAGDDPDVIVGCTGGGSNFAGIAFPFIGQQLRGKGKTKQRRIVAVEPAACPSASRAASSPTTSATPAHLTPLTKMHTLGSTFTPPGFHAGGLRYHGMAPLVSAPEGAQPDRGHRVPPERLLRGGRAVCACRRHRACAPEANHAVKRRHRRGAALQGRRQESEVILFNLCGHGHFDMTAYQQLFCRQAHGSVLQLRRNWPWPCTGLPSVPA